MARFDRRRYTPLLVAVGLAACGAFVLCGLDGSGPRAAHGSADQQAKFSSEILRGTAERVELASDAKTGPIQSKNRVRAKPSSRATQDGRVLDRKAGAEENSLFNVNVMPSWMHEKTPAVGSPEWKQEQQETERQEREVRRAIEGICRGC